MKIVWKKSKSAEKIKEGSVVIIRSNRFIGNSKIKKPFAYTLTHYFMPDWIKHDYYGPVERTEFAVLEKPIE